MIRPGRGLLLRRWQRTLHRICEARASLPLRRRSSHRLLMPLPCCIFFLLLQLSSSRSPGLTLPLQFSLSGFLIRSLSLFPPGFVGPPLFLPYIPICKGELLPGRGGSSSSTTPSSWVGSSSSTTPARGGGSSSSTTPSRLPGSRAGPHPTSTSSTPDWSLPTWTGSGCTPPRSTLSNILQPLLHSSHLFL